MVRITREDPATTAFVIRCLQRGAIEAHELRAWAEELLVTEPDCPIYIEALTEFDGRPGEVYRWVGFVPEREFSREEDRAIEAIAALRRSAGLEACGKPEGTDEALRTCASVVYEFRRTFPLLSLG